MEGTTVPAQGGQTVSTCLVPSVASTRLLERQALLFPGTGNTAHAPRSQSRQALIIRHSTPPSTLPSTPSSTPHPQIAACPFAPPNLADPPSRRRETDLI